PVLIPKEEFQAQQQREKELMVQPNSQGEIWVTVYSEDGTTSIGKKLVNEGDDEFTE
ncbi:MAG: hypothetical protein JWP10_756, partial [Nocardioidaceae bacterium]|nr:hypothetical protein [Nocardioidaceae bacterium]